MDLTRYIDHLGDELAVAAHAGGDEARALAERLIATLESAVRLTLLDALSAAAEEITGELAPGSVGMRLRGLEPEFVVTAAPPMAPSVAPLAPSAQPTVDGDGGGTVRIGLRLPAPLKARVEEAAGRLSLSVNAWLVQAVAAALEPTAPHDPTAAHRTA
ncbi:MULTISPECIES: hypothetical protein [Streptomyces]|uniref:Toxin-antitoxin system HicB family antitoxin n=1 Tax=Streptomyces solicathayae TaxID=3081768 RepID=A0ABZ0LPU1_9ACTN|nr:hypothetical protein [Streptomyces sp. HUAS YS2]WOX21300.1 hypothetical protein R2D22_07840 [Streptomyces sp. HUAS YS2]